MQQINDYLSKIEEKRLVGGKELSYRSALENLIESLGGKSVNAVNDPAHLECGAPDVHVYKKDRVIGYIECKDLGHNLELSVDTEQLQRYRDALPNLIYTNYKNFILFRDGVKVLSADIERQQEEWLNLLEVFFNFSGVSISSAKILAVNLAGKARLLRTSIQTALAQENGGGRLSTLFKTYKQTLISNLDAHRFCDMQAQTAVYGLFAAAINSSKEGKVLTRENALFEAMNPFLRELLAQVAGYQADKRTHWILEDIVTTLNSADLGRITQEFSAGDPYSATILHFYETFLSEYDASLREKTGSYYTPKPIVAFICSNVDRLLRTTFGFKNGVAGDFQSNNISQPIILDPAAGTGTFLVETIGLISKEVTSAGMEGMWQSYIYESIVKRIYGFELECAPYTIAHLLVSAQLGLDSHQESDSRIGIYLTNSLIAPEESTHGSIFAHEIAQETLGAERVKSQEDVMVVLGNPPYQGHSQTNTNWIKGLVNDYKKGFDELSKPGQAKWLNNDYVKFIRFAQWKIEKTGKGMVAFITDNSYLDNPTFLGMRKSLLVSYDKIYIVNLHGNQKKREKTDDGLRDENVFPGVMQGVAVTFFIKSSKTALIGENAVNAEVNYVSLKGFKSEKYQRLSGAFLDDFAWESLKPSDTNRWLFVPIDERGANEYISLTSLPQIFSEAGKPAPGLVSTHDEFAFGISENELVNKIERFLATQTEEQARSIFRLCSTNQWNYANAKTSLSAKDWKKQIVRVLYRPFNYRYTVYDSNVAVHRRERVNNHLISPGNLALVTTRQTKDNWGCIISDCIVAHKAFANYDINYVFPLYNNDSTLANNDANHLGMKRINHFNKDYIKKIVTLYDKNFDDKPLDWNLESRPHTHSIHPEDILFYIFGLAQSNLFKKKYQDFLMRDYMRVPCVGSYDIFTKISEEGRILARYHLRKKEWSNLPDFSGSGENVISVYKEKKDRIYINDTQYLEGIDFTLATSKFGGYYPLKKWITDRMGLVLSFGEVTEMRSIMGCLEATKVAALTVDSILSDYLDCRGEFI